MPHPAPDTVPNTAPDAVPDTAPEAAVIIPHYDDVARLARCLGALGAQDLAGLEIVVVDNASPLDMAAALAPFRADIPALRLVVEPARGAAAARNRGVRETTAPLLWFLDADCVPAPDWVAAARAAAPSADLVGGAIAIFDETPPPRSGAEAFEAVFAFDYRDYATRKGFAVTANLLTRRDVFAATGDFVPGLAEDLDWCRRATAKGYRLGLAESVRVGHPARPDWASLAKKWRRLTDEGFAVNGRSPAARLRWGLRALAMPPSALAHAPKVLGSPRLAGGPDRARALATLARLRLWRCGWMLRQAVRG